VFAGTLTIANAIARLPSNMISVTKLMKMTGKKQVARFAPGFTLLEVLVVVGIIATLSSIAWPVWQNHITSSQQAVLIPNIQSITLFQESHKLRHGSYAVGLADRVEIAAALGWTVASEGAASYEINDSDGSFYQVVAREPDGITVCLQMPSNQRC
jgi:prepilin-type N-terminal cleavage/methylation domain-containing protein